MTGGQSGEAWTDGLWPFQVAVSQWDPGAQEEFCDAWAWRVSAVIERVEFVGYPWIKYGAPVMMQPVLKCERTKEEWMLPKVLGN